MTVPISSDKCIEGRGLTKNVFLRDRFCLLHKLLFCWTFLALALYDKILQKWFSVAAIFYKSCSCQQFFLSFNFLVAENWGLYDCMCAKWWSFDRFNSTLQMVQAAGETNRIQQGLFENYLESKVKDPRLLLVSHLQSWCVSHYNLSELFLALRLSPFAIVTGTCPFPWRVPVIDLYVQYLFSFLTLITFNRGNTFGELLLL